MFGACAVSCAPSVPVGGVPHVGLRGLILCRWGQGAEVTPTGFPVKLIPRRSICSMGREGTGPGSRLGLPHGRARSRIRIVREDAPCPGDVALGCAP